MGTSVLSSGLMTQVDALAPNTNFDYRTSTYIRKPAGGGSAGEIRALLYFARPFPLRATITSAKIVLYSTATAQTGTISVVCQRIKTATSFTKVTWNNRPITAYPGSVTTSKTGPLAAGTLWEIDVTAMMQSVSLGDPWYGFNLSSTTINPALPFYDPSHSNVALRPRLEVEWSDAPFQPLGLSPSGGRAVSTNKPILRCDYVDIAGETEMQAIQVQMAWSGSTFAAPNFDTWTVLSSTPELDLNGTFSRSTLVTTANGSATVTGVAGTFSSADVGATITGTGIPAATTVTAFASSTSITISAAATASGTGTKTFTRTFSGFSDGSAYQWRARVQDAAGLWSDWSDEATLVRDIKGTLTLDNPSSGTPIVEESTPPFSWTLTGETQAAYQLTIAEYDTDGLTSTWTTGKKTATTTTVTPPVGVLTSPDSTYKATLRLWDSKQRESTPGDPAYYEVTRDFTYVPTATVTATTSPTAAPQNPYPRVVVGWQRATDPDSFTILRNRKVIASGLIPANVRVSGSTFTYIDRSAPPATTLVYEVQAVVGGKASASNPTATCTLTPYGMWLADSTRANEVLILGKDDRAIVYGEDSEAINAVGATETVVVTQAMRGMEGTITGELHGNIGGLGITAQQWRDKALRIKSQAGKKCWLTVADQTFQCVIRNLTVAPRPTTPLSFKISFDFYQVGTLQAGYVPSL